jgi:hypothetical protein
MFLPFFFGLTQTCLRALAGRKETKKVKADDGIGYY